MLALKASEIRDEAGATSILSPFLGFVNIGAFIPTVALYFGRILHNSTGAATFVPIATFVIHKAPSRHWAQLPLALDYLPASEDRSILDTQHR